MTAASPDLESFYEARFYAISEITELSKDVPDDNLAVERTVRDVEAASFRKRFLRKSFELMLRMSRFGDVERLEAARTHRASFVIT